MKPSVRTKTSCILHEIIFKYHPDFKNDAHSRRIFEKHQDVINIEKLVEQTMAHIGGYNFVDGHGYDFDDGEKYDCPNSECKTASVRMNPVPRGSRVSHVLEISNICRTGPQGGQKCGALRVVLYNAVTHSLNFYFIPKHAWSEMIYLHPTSGIGKIVATWNSDTNTCNKLDEFEEDSFDVLAQLPPNYRSEPFVMSEYIEHLFE